MAKFVEVDLVEAGSRELGKSSVDVVLGEIRSGIESVAEALTRLGERESIVLVKVAAGSLGVLDDVRARDIVVVEDLSQLLAIVAFESGRDRRDTGVPGLVGSDSVGDALGDEYGLAVLDGPETVDGFADTGVGLSVSGFGVFPAHTIGRVAVVADRATAFAAGRSRDRVDGLAVGIEVREDIAALPERAEVLGEQAGAEDGISVVASCMRRSSKPVRLGGAQSSRALSMVVSVHPRSWKYSRALAERLGCPPSSSAWSAICRSS